MKRFRKSIALLMAMALLLLPAVSLGEAAPSSIFDKVTGAGRSMKTTVTFEPGEMLTQDPSTAGIADLFSALRLEAASQKYAAGMLYKLDLFLQDNPALSFTALDEPDEAHLFSNLLEKPVSATLEETLNMYTMVMERNIAQMEQIDPSMAAFYKAYLEAYTSAMKGEEPTLPEFDQQSLEQDLLTPAKEWYDKLVASPERTQGTFESGKHDTATVQVVYSLSITDIAALLTVAADWAVKDVNLDRIISLIAEMNPDAGDLSGIREEVRDQIKGMPAGFALEAAPYLPDPITLTLLEDDAGEIKAAELNATIASPEGDADEIVTVKAGYYVKTEADGKGKLFSLEAGTTTDRFSMAFTEKEFPATASGSDTVSGKQWRFTMDMTQWNMSTFNLDLAFDSSKTVSASAIRDAWKLSFEAGSYGDVFGILLDNSASTVPQGADVRMDGRLDVYLTGQSSPLASVLYTAATGEPLEVPVVPEDSVRPGKMTMEELEAWAQQAGDYALTGLMGVIAYLPPSVLTMMSGRPAY